MIALLEKYGIMALGGVCALLLISLIITSAMLRSKTSSLKAMTADRDLYLSQTKEFASKNKELAEKMSLQNEAFVTLQNKAMEREKKFKEQQERLKPIIDAHIGKIPEIRKVLITKNECTDLSNIIDEARK